MKPKTAVSLRKKSVFQIKKKKIWLRIEWGREKAVLFIHRQIYVCNLCKFILSTGTDKNVLLIFPIPQCMALSSLNSCQTILLED